MRRELTAADLIRHFGMSDMETENVKFHQAWIGDPGPDGRPVGTAIVALLTDEPGSFSDMHRLPTDEFWHFYLGDPIELLLLHPDGSDELRVLGHDLLGGQLVQTRVPTGTWMGARVRPGGRFALFGNTMAPGFTLDGFEAGDRVALSGRYPHRRDLIRRLTRD
jgi:predicted cupin superfamily sugar epimerase